MKKIKKCDKKSFDLICKRSKEIFLFAFLFYSLTTLANMQTQKLSLTFNNAKMSAALKKIGTAAKVKILFNSEDVQDYIVSAKIKDKDVTETLDIIIGSKPFSYKINDGFVTVYKNRKVESPPKTSATKQTAQQRVQKDITLSGTIISSSDDEPLIGVSVYVPNTSYGTITDANGRYTLVVPENTKTVSFKYIGYLDKKIDVAKKFLFQLVTMIEEVHQLNEAIVVGFGVQKKESVVGAVQSVKPEDLHITSSNLTSSFAGNIAGLITRQTSGEPGQDGTDFYIRGVSTFGASNAALIVLDGVEVTSYMLAQIAPETIESFSVLKDATATALYGSRGANGVIIVTTKSGHESEKMRVKCRVETSVSMPTRIPDSTDGVTYMNAYNEAVKNTDMENNMPYVPYYSDEKIEGTRKHLNRYIFPDNDWYNMMFKNAAFNETFNFNMSGGSKYINYYLNAAAINEDGIIKQPKESKYDVTLSNKKFVFQSNINAAITKTTRVGLKMNTQLMYNHRPIEDISNLFYYTMQVTPTWFPAVLPAEAGDAYVRYGNNTSWTTGSYDVNPYASLSRGYEDRHMSYFISTLDAEQKLDFLIKGLTASGQASFYNYTYVYYDRSFTPFFYKVSDYSVDNNGNYVLNEELLNPNKATTYLSYNTSGDGRHVWSLQGKLNYENTFDKHDITAMMVYHMRETQSNRPTSTEESVLPQREQGFAGRLTYNFDKRYFFEYDFGYTGSENFTKGHRWGFFPSYAVGYMISNETFFEPLKKIITSMKLRASFGIAGNDYLSNRFPYLTDVVMNSATNFYLYGNGFSQKGAPYISNYGNPEATWEKAKKWNLGIDIKLLDALSVSVDFFKEKRTGIFMRRTALPSTFGLNGRAPYANIGAVNKHGVDISANWNKVVNKDLIYSIRGTFTYASDKIMERDEQHIYPYAYQKGHPVSSYQGLVADGLFSSKEEIARSPIQGFSAYTVGDIKYRDLNGDGVIDANDVTTIGKPYIPQIIYGFGGSLKYHQFDFNFLFQGAARVSIGMSDFYPFSDGKTYGYTIAKYIVKDHYSETNPNPHASFPRLTASLNGNNYPSDYTSTYFVKNADYIRLKSLEIGYTFNSFRFSVAGYNLFCLTPFKYWDPEMGPGNGLSYPLQRTFKLGVQYEF